ncbi:response regulator [Rugamonas sp.]|uniref:response regulator n=1 Tax=Rugamonas sp. TaxID=1926287 RepID=UPI0025D56947|nr:response regulator [Rugamonas sp.]
MQFPIYSHPTLTVLVDDSDSFLKSLSFQLDPQLVSTTFYDSRSALAWLERQGGGRAGAPPLHVNYDTQNQAQDQCNVAVDLERIYRIAERSERFATPAVLVVDYSMPQMNGIEFCAALRHLPCKKILFTGAADEKIAVNAFNRGLIDRYIQKSAVHALDTLEQEIAALQADYFSARSETLRDLVVLHHYPFMRDAAIAALARELALSMGFVEHYIFPNPTGILFLDRDGKATLMIIETEQGMQAQYEIARDSDAPPSLLDALLERRVLPFFSDPYGDGMYARGMGDNWHRYCAPPRLCQGQQLYFWALFELPAHYFAAPVFSYAQFLRERHAPGAMAA